MAGVQQKECKTVQTMCGERVTWDKEVIVPDWCILTSEEHARGRTLAGRTAVVPPSRPARSSLLTAGAPRTGRARGDSRRLAAASPPASAPPSVASGRGGKTGAAAGAAAAAVAAAAAEVAAADGGGGRPVAAGAAPRGGSGSGRRGRRRRRRGAARGNEGEWEE
ncbi:alanine and glycine-rich protein-like [Penaeus japonicus]|uniref:alanine and glycine-rich protein-like n=1 Tax=Penaeus japonicus TaxID=27405 RepID=UPI001C70C3B5|nr:alanine and glycine-rich protein-like [Penaeus japonicus]